MATNPYVNKVVYGNDTVMDLTSDTATPSDVLLGATFHDRSGAPQTGSLDLGEYTTIDLLKETVGWTGKNIFDSSLLIGNPSYVTKNETGSVIEITKSTAGSWASSYWLIPVETSTSYAITCSCVATSGVGRIKVTNSDASVTLNEMGDITTSGDLNFTFNSGSNTSVRVILFATGSTTETGDVTYNNLMLRKATISDSTYEPYHQTVEDCKYNRSEANVLGAKNLLAYPYRDTTKTDLGITFTDNGDGTITINGTNTSSSYRAFFYLYPVDYDGLAIGQYIFTKNSTDTNIGVYIQAYNGSTWVSDLVNTTADNSTFSVDYSGYDHLVSIIYVMPNATVNNVTIKPMIRLASDPDDTYVPYAMTNRELTDTKADKSEIPTVGSGKLNIYRNGKIIEFSANATSNSTLFLDKFYPTQQINSNGEARAVDVSDDNAYDLYFKDAIYHVLSVSKTTPVSGLTTITFTTDAPEGTDYRIRCSYIDY